MLELLIGFVVGCAATFLFARLNKRKFNRYMTTSLTDLMENTQKEIDDIKDSETAKAIIAKLKARLEELLKNAK